MLLLAQPASCLSYNLSGVYLTNYVLARLAFIKLMLLQQHALHVSRNAKPAQTELFAPPASLPLRKYHQLGHCVFALLHSLDLHQLL